MNEKNENVANDATEIKSETKPKLNVYEAVALGQRVISVERTDITKHDSKTGKKVPMYKVIATTSLIPTIIDLQQELCEENKTDLIISPEYKDYIVSENEDAWTCQFLCKLSVYVAHEPNVVISATTIGLAIIQKTQGGRPADSICASQEIAKATTMAYKSALIQVFLANGEDPETEKNKQDLKQDMLDREQKLKEREEKLNDRIQHYKGILEKYYIEHPDERPGGEVNDRVNPYSPH